MPPVPRTTEFNRPPRVFPPFPKGEIRVPEPPNLPSEPQKPSMLMMLLPAGGMLLMGGLSALVMSASGTANNPLMLFMPFVGLIMAVAMPAAQWLTHRQQHKQWLAECEKVEQDYQNELAELADQLHQLRSQQQQSSLKIHPPTTELLQRAMMRDGRLWERRPDDADFLFLRFGIYTAKPLYDIKLLEGERRDERKKRANEAVRGFGYVPSAPCTLNLPEVGSVGIAGPAAFTEGVARTLLLNLATHHAPSEVRVFALLDDREPEMLSTWAWLRWLPHARGNLNETRGRQMAGNVDGRREVLRTLLEEMQRREQAIKRNEAPDSKTPYWVVLCPSLNAVRGQEALKIILRMGPTVRASIIFLCDSPKDIPSQCGARLEYLAQEYACDFRLAFSQPDTPEINGQSEKTDIAQAERLARSLAPINYATDTEINLPSAVHLSGLFRKRHPYALNLPKIWEEHLPRERQLTAPIGIASGNEILELMLHTTAHGNHGLIAGTTGAGKTVLLTTMIAALAIANSPRLVNFAIVDMKGDKDLAILRDLPHTVGFAAVGNTGDDLRPDQLVSYITRAITALRAEIDRRNSILVEAKARDMFEYNERNPQRPIPHLMVIIDEFAVLKKQAPDLVDKLVEVSALGRSPSVHLVLCTQSPGGGTVSDKIQANMQFRLCLRVASDEESRSVLQNRVDAARLPNKPQGRAFLSASGDMGEVFKLFQVAYSGGRISRNTGQESQQMVVGNFEIAEVTPDSQRKVLYEHKIKKDTLRTGLLPPTELEVVVEESRRVALDQGIQLPMPGPWLPPLKELLLLENVLQSHRLYRQWDTAEGWSQASLAERWLRVPMGMIDLPAQKIQPPLVVNFANMAHHHLWLCDVRGDSLMLVLRTLVVSLACSHAPDEVQFYILAFGGGGALNVLNRFPHVGDVIRIHEIERLRLFIKRLKREVERRQHLLTEHDASDIQSYRALGHPVPAWFILIEDFGKLQKEAQSQNELQEVLDSIHKLTSTVKALDIHLVIATNTHMLYRDMASQMGDGRLPLRLNNLSDYSEMLNERPGFQIDDNAGPGRGYWKWEGVLAECQIATPFYKDGNAQTASIEMLGKAMSERWQGDRPAKITPLGTTAVVPLQNILPTNEVWQSGIEGDINLPIGLDDDGQTVVVNISEMGGLLMVGNTKSGRTQTLQWLSAMLMAHHNPQTLEMMACHLAPNSGLVKFLAPLGVACYTEENTAQKAFETLKQNITNNHATMRRVVIIDEWSSRSYALLNNVINDCFKAGRDKNVLWLIAPDMSSMPYGDLADNFKSMQCGLLMVQGANDHSHMFGVGPQVKPLTTKANLTPGRAFLMTKPGEPRLIQVAKLEAHTAEGVLHQRLEAWREHQR